MKDVPREQAGQVASCLRGWTSRIARDPWASASDRHHAGVPHDLPCRPAFVYDQRSRVEVACRFGIRDPQERTKAHRSVGAVCSTDSLPE